MPLEVSFEFGETGITVPYRPVKDRIRNNRGFVDLRGRPDLVEDIAEASASPALRSILKRLAQPGFAVVSLGCDMGQHEEPDLPSNGRYVAGGYIQVAPLTFDGSEPERCEHYAEAVIDHLHSEVQSCWWQVKPTFCWVYSYLSGDLQEVPSVWFWFWCLARSRKAADLSRERFLNVLSTGLTNEEALRNWDLSIANAFLSPRQ